MSRINRIGLWAVIFLCALSSPRSSIGADGDGNKLLSDCDHIVALIDGQTVQESKSSGIFFCLGLIQGMLDMNDLYEYKLKDVALLCRPQGATTGQAARIVVKYLRDHPEELHKKDSVLTFVALRAAFPCTKKK